MNAIKLIIGIYLIATLATGCSTAQDEVAFDSISLTETFSAKDFDAAELLLQKAEGAEDVDLEVDMENAAATADAYADEDNSLSDTDVSVSSPVALKDQSRNLVAVCFQKRYKNNLYHNVIIDLPDLEKYVALTVKTNLTKDGDSITKKHHVLSRRRVFHSQKNIYIKSLDTTKSVDFYKNLHKHFIQAIASNWKLPNKPIYPGRFFGPIAKKGKSVIFISTPSLCYKPKVTADEPTQTTDPSETGEQDSI